MSSRNPWATIQNALQLCYRSLDYHLISTSILTPTGYQHTFFCNEKKRAQVFEPSPLIQLILKNARRKAPEAEARAAEIISTRKLASALNLLEQATEAGELPGRAMEALKPLVLLHEQRRAPELIGKPIRLTPFYEVISEKDSIRTVVSVR